MKSPMFILAIIIISSSIFNVVYGIPWKAEQHKGTENKHQHLLNQTHRFGEQIRAIFLGDSITEGWLNNGHNVWKQFYESRHSFNYGISGDRTEHVLWRIDHGEFDGLHPTVIVLMIGTNNISIKDTPGDIAKGIKMILEKLHEKMRETQILLLSIFPRGGDTPDKNVAEINEIIQHFHDEESLVYYLEVTNDFEIGPGKVIDKLYVSDHLHLNEKGYEMWQKVMEPEFSKLL
ncbi:hypothetical protein BLA29_000416 [Euroglyphus maynei]|uniref:SGNH hydrolase-type esterase domain-containing protein n=1 Tax=Euroglyphus maynei TaxID=6958 RepID=A0A1Y3BI12_EURMA|nr:hypothetical protein BLA29_000416 [Euroglyphus maynei]